MKKFICLVLSLILIFGLSACGGKPSTVSDEMYDAGLSVLKAVDDYMDNKIDYDTASSKIDGLRDTMDRIYENGERTEYDSPVYSDDLMVQILTNPISIHLLGEHTGHSTYNELLDARNELAQLLGRSNRKK